MSRSCFWYFAAAAEVALVLGERRELLEELGVAGVGREQALELAAGRAEVARGGVGLGQADGQLALLVRPRVCSRSSRAIRRSNWLRWR